VARPVRRAARAVAVEAAVMVLVAAALSLFHQAALAQLAPPPPPSPVCGSPILNGPSSPPGGAVTVPAGDNSAVNFGIASTTYWFAAGTHTLGTGQFSQIHPGNNSTFLGAPGAVLDGQDLNNFAFTGTSTGVTIEYLTIENFTPPGSQGAVNTDGGPGWTEQFNTMEDNLPGAATMAGSNAVIDWNCLTTNGEYGFNAFTSNDVSANTGGAFNVTIDNNEITQNDTCNWEAIPALDFPITPPSGCTGAGQFSGCGCSGGGKFWENDTGQFEGNYVLDNYAVGAWWDTDNSGWQVSGNYFAGNFASAIIYEISYNASITGNTFVDNAWGSAPFAPGFPVGAVYISESGSDPRAPGPNGTSFAITSNQFYDNWGGVILWENANRFCGTRSPTNDHACTLVNPLWSVNNLIPCGGASYTTSPLSRAPVPRGRRTPGRGGTTRGSSAPANIFLAPYINDCRWKTQNVHISGNLFDFTPANISPACTTAALCGFNGVFSEAGITPPYTGTFVENNITFNQGNLFTGNTYCGPWQFDVFEQGTVSSFATWQGAPYNQDPGSTLNGAACTPALQQTVPQRRVSVPAQIPYHGGRR
jgi:hypothetical protein